MACSTSLVSQLVFGGRSVYHRFICCRLPFLTCVPRAALSQTTDEVGRSAHQQSTHLTNRDHLESAEFSVPLLPPYRAREDESLDVKVSRLCYQSRKRGMSENGLLLSCFADKYLEKFNSEQLAAYDELINVPSNDWDIYYWISGIKPVPEVFQTDVMTLLQDFVKNEERHSRLRQPDLKEK